jgi:hypothetical protein
MTRWRSGMGDRGFVAARGLAILTCVCIATLVGCGSEELDGTYGKRRGSPGGRSVNGTSVLAKMFEDAGHDVTTLKHLSPALERYEVIVWAPDSFDPPSRAERRYLENWLMMGNNRLLIYIGRDFDAEPLYWKTVQPSAPAEQTKEVQRRLARAQSEYHSERTDMPKEAYCRWFTVRRDGVRRRVKSLRGPWSKNIDPERAEIYLWGRFDAPVYSDLSLEPAEEEEDDPFEMYYNNDINDWQYGSPDPEDLPDFVEVLLASKSDPLVTSVSEGYWPGGRIIVVTNGSFLVNYALINHEHRKLASLLIDECGRDANVAFLQSGPDGAPIRQEEAGTEYPVAWKALTVWPLGTILMHLAVLGILFCFARAGIFGRAKTLPPDATSDFGKHVKSLGELLALTRDHDFAKRRLQQYQMNTRGEEANMPPPLKKSETKT